MSCGLAGRLLAAAGVLIQAPSNPAESRIGTLCSVVERLAYRGLVERPYLKLLDGVANVANPHRSLCGLDNALDSELNSNGPRLDARSGALCGSLDDVDHEIDEPPQRTLKVSLRVGKCPV